MLAAALILTSCTSTKPMPSVTVTALPQSADQLKIQIPTGWKCAEGPRQDYPYRCVHETSTYNGVLDITVAYYNGGEVPDPSYDDLVKVAKATPSNKSQEALTATQSGDCLFGKYGTAISRSPDYQYIQRWALSNGKDFILAEYHNYVMPEDIELREVQQMVKTLTLRNEPVP